MRINQMYEGQCYVLRKAFTDIPSIGLDIQNGNLALPFKEGGGRPFLCVKKDMQSGIVWLAPLSTKYEKYLDIANKRIEKNGYCNDYVFTKFNDRDNVVIVSQTFPVLPSFVKRPFIPLQEGEQGSPSNHYPISAKSRRIVGKYFHIKMNAYHRGNKSFMTDVSAHIKYMNDNDFRPFKSLNANERQNIIETLYMTDTLKQNAGRRNETETLAYMKEYQALVQELTAWRGTFYNPHNCTIKKEITYNFGSERFSYFKGKKCHYEYTNNILATLRLSNILDSLKIPYRGTITFQGKGQIRILDSDKKTFKDYIAKEYDNTHKRDIRWIGNIPRSTILNSDKCVKFEGLFPYKMAVTFFARLSENRTSFACYFGAEGATIFVYERDIDIAKSILENAVRDYNNALSLTQESISKSNNYAVTAASL